MKADRNQMRVIRAELANHLLTIGMLPNLESKSHFNQLQKYGLKQTYNQQYDQVFKDGDILFNRLDMQPFL